MVRVDRQTFRRLGRLVKPFFFSSVKWQARGLLLLLALFAVSIVAINYQLSFLERDFYTAFTLKEHDQFVKRLAIFLVAMACATPVYVFYSYTEQRLALLWRKWLSREILQRYFSNMAFYKINWHEGIDNPDQRMEEDVRSFTTTTLSLFLILLNNLLTVILFISLLWSISVYLIIAVVLYALCGSLITYGIGRPLIGLNFAQLKKEADYRYKLVNVRDHAESIAFYRGDRKELTRTRQRLKEALKNSLRIINLNRNLQFFIMPYSNLQRLVPVMIVAPLYLNGNIEFGVVAQSSGAFVRVVEALSMLITQFGTISGVAAVVSRLGSFTEALDEVASPPLHFAQQIETKEGDRVLFDRVSIMTPRRDQVLLRDVSFELVEGGLLISGGSGFGKSSILRVLAGLWTAGEGRVIRPPQEVSVFLPQRPYLVLGSLRNQLLYALHRRGVSDSELQDVMTRVGLRTALERVQGLDALADWPSILSAGEQQQLAFARLLLAKPKYVFLDEATTAVDTAMEQRLYGLLKESAIAYVSVGYRANLSRFHSHLLEVKERGGWSFGPIEQQVST